MKKTNKVPIYYPQIPVDPRYFAGREKILTDVYNIVNSTIQKRPENMAVYGVRGIGKTSFTFKIREMVLDECFKAYYAAPKELDTKEFHYWD